MANPDLRDKVSARLGDYLLMGATMLASHCEVCGTVQIRKRRQIESASYCVLCDELSLEEVADDGAHGLPNGHVVVPERPMNGHAHRDGPVAQLTATPDVVTSYATAPVQHESRGETQASAPPPEATEDTQPSLQRDVLNVQIQRVTNELRNATTPTAIAEWARALAEVATAYKALDGVVWRST